MPILKPNGFSYLLAFGSNIEPRMDYIQDSLALLQKYSLKILRISKVYKSNPIGAATMEFLNGVLLGTSPANPKEMLGIIQNIEKILKRTRNEKWGNRTIDIDILLIKDRDKYLTIDESDLRVPHPEMTNRDFVLVPANEIAGDWLIGKKKICELIKGIETTKTIKMEAYTSISIKP